MVEQVTGFTREVLRKWESRYGFPLPERGARGQRMYSHADVEKLMLIRELMATGARPSRLATLATPALRQQAEALRRVVPAADRDSGQRAASLLQALSLPSQAGLVQTLLERWLGQDGPVAFACECLPYLAQAVGSAWAGGTLPIHQEHWFSERMRRVLTTARTRCASGPGLPRVLLTTPPGEAHELALLGLELALASRDVDAHYLGPQTPIAELCAAAQQLQASAIALSLGPHTDPLLVTPYLIQVRSGVPAHCQIWVGGGGVSRLVPWPAGLLRFESLSEAVEHCVRAYRTLQPSTTVPAS